MATEETQMAYNAHCTYLVLHMLAAPLKDGTTECNFALQILKPIYDGTGVVVVGHSGPIYLIDSNGNPRMDLDINLLQVLRMKDRLLSAWLTPMGLPMFNSTLRFFSDLKRFESQIGGIPFEKASQLFQSCVDEVILPQGDPTERSIMWALRVIEQAIVKDIIRIKCSHAPEDLTTMLGKLFGQTLGRRETDDARSGATYVGSIVDRFFHDPWVNELSSIQRDLKPNEVNVPAKDLEEMIQFKIAEFDSLKEDMERGHKKGPLGSLDTIEAIRSINEEIKELNHMRTRYIFFQKADAAKKAEQAKMTAKRIEGDTTATEQTSNTKENKPPQHSQRLSATTSTGSKRKLSEIDSNVRDKTQGEPVAKKLRNDSSTGKPTRPGKYLITFGSPGRLNKKNPTLSFVPDTEKMKKEILNHEIRRPEASVYLKHEWKLDWKPQRVHHQNEGTIPPFTISEENMQRIYAEGLEDLEPTRPRKAANRRLFTEDDEEQRPQPDAWASFGKAFTDVYQIRVAFPTMSRKSAEEPNTNGKSRSEETTGSRSRIVIPDPKAMNKRLKQHLSGPPQSRYVDKGCDPIDIPSDNDNNDATEAVPTKRVKVDAMKQQSRIIKRRSQKPKTKTTPAKSEIVYENYLYKIQRPVEAAKEFRNDMMRMACVIA